MSFLFKRIRQLLTNDRPIVLETAEPFVGSADAAD